MKNTRCRNSKTEESDKKFREIKPIKLAIQLGTVSIKALVDFGNVSAIVHESLAKAITNAENQTYWSKVTAMSDLKIVSNELIKTYKWLLLVDHVVLINSFETIFNSLIAVAFDQ